MGGIVKFLVTLAVTFIAYGVYRLSRVIYEELTSPMRDLPGPKSTSLLAGSLKDAQQDESLLVKGWVRKYGRVFQFKGLFSLTCLYIADTKALNYVLMNSYDYQKPDNSRYTLSLLVGPGVLVVEGDEHKRLRKIMNPAFSPANIRQYTDIFIKKAAELRDIWVAESVKQGGIGRVNVCPWLSKMTLDVIGLAGFNYTFDLLTNKKSEVNDAFETMFNTDLLTHLPILSILKAIFPIFRLIPFDQNTRMKQAQDTMARIGNQLLRESKAQAAGTSEEQSSRDLLSLLVRANMATDVPESQRMSDKDVLAQVPTFIVAGHETTSNAIIWTLFALTQAPMVQSKLREELFTIDTDNSTMDELNGLPYLDMVVRESLRVHAPVPLTSRVAMKDDILPLSEPVTDCKGKVHHTLRIRKGQMVFVPIVAMNNDKSIWGEDADEFRPERWESIPEASSTIPGVWGNMLTFLGGPRACIGYRFALIEMKVLLFILIRAFDFDLAVPSKDILKKSSGIVSKPVLATDPDHLNQMPLLIKPFLNTVNQI